MATYSIEYARSGRAGCKKCNGKIAKGKLRIGITTESLGYPMTKWNHLSCFALTRSLKNRGLTSKEFVDSFLQDHSGILSDAAKCKKIVETIEANSGGGTTTTATKRKAGHVGKFTGILATVQTNAEIISQDDEEKKAQLTAKEKEDVIAFLKYKSLKNQELAYVLRNNHQFITGTKSILLTRVMDGVMNGRLAPCPSCGKGRLKLSDDGLTVSCGGYYDEDVMSHISCSAATIDVKDAPRFQPWYGQEPTADEKAAMEKEIEEAEQSGGNSGEGSSESVTTTSTSAAIVIQQDQSTSTISANNVPMSESEPLREEEGNGESATTTSTSAAIAIQQDQSTSTINVPSSESEPLREEEPEVEDVEEFILMGTANYSLVGIRYYNGVAHPGEYVTLVREPHNPYDRNAVRVDNMHGEKVGHVKREQAAKIAPLLDDASRLSLKIEGTIPHPGNSFSLPLELPFYCCVGGPTGTAVDQDQKVEMLKKVLTKRMSRDHNFRFASNIDGLGMSPEESVTVHKKTIDWNTQTKELDDMFDQMNKEKMNNLPNLQMPTQFNASVKLYKYQEEGIKWMYKKETAPEINPFYESVVEKGKKKWLCSITKSSQNETPMRTRGSILADEMGLGKTIQTIGLILAAPPNNHEYTDNSCQESNGDKNNTPILPIPSVAKIESQKAIVLKSILKEAGLKVSSRKADQVQRILGGIDGGTILPEHFPPEMMMTQSQVKEGKGAFCTLIVCPVSVISNWQKQIDDHVTKNVLRVAIYHGPNRTDLLPDIQGQIDVLLASYQTLAADYNNTHATEDNSDVSQLKKKAKRESIFDVDFHRIVLDEAHTIRSKKTNMFKAVKSIKADRKLALTGTPYVNRADDVYSLMSFLEVEPLSDHDIFRRGITQPIQQGDDIGLTRLRTAMAHIAIRRSKQASGIKLAGKKVEVSAIEFPNNAHKKVYDALFGTVRLALQAVLQDGDTNVLKNYSTIFEKILRLRQSCCSGELVSQKRREIALEMWNGLQKEGKKLTAEEGMALLEKLKDDFSQNETFECAVCLLEMEMQDSVILKQCKHVYCEGCISRVAKMSNDRKCPLCRAPFHLDDIITGTAAAAAANQKKESSAEKPNDDFGTSPKILALLEAMSAMQTDEKGVIFSQFTSFLNLIGDALEEKGYTFVRIDGSMPAKKRLQSIAQFSSDEEGSPRFILCSLHAAGTGINLTRGNHAFMMDCWWNQAVENQAMDRIHRIGQEREVSVQRFVMKDSIEEKIMKLQETKSLQAKGTMEKLEGDEKRKVLINNLRGLLDLDLDNE